MQAIENSNPGSAPAGNLPAIMPGSQIDFGRLDAETSICLKSGGREYRISANDVLKWVAPGAPVSEAVRLLVVAQNTGLNPMLKDVELLSVGGQWHIYVRKQGLIKAALRYPEYDGMESGIVVQAIGADADKSYIDIDGTICPGGHRLVGGWAKVYRKGVSRPAYKRVPLDKYDRKSGVWNSNASMMIEKVAIMQALRDTFPIGEVYDESELPGVPQEAEDATHERQARVASPEAALEQYDESALTRALEAEYTPAQPEVAIATSAAPASSTEDLVIDVTPVDTEAEPHEGPCTPKQLAELADLVQRAGMGEKSYRGMLARRGVETPEQLTVLQATQIIIALTERVSAKEFQP